MRAVSVILPTHNRRQQLARAVASIEAQTFRDFELIVVDDASTDGTAAWLREAGIAAITLPHSQGASAARNRGLAEARGEFAAFLDDDDVWRPAYLEIQVEQLARHPAAELATVGHIEVDAAGRISRPDVRPLFPDASPMELLAAQCPIHTLSVVACRRSMFARIGGLDEELAIVHDLDLYLRLLAAGGSTVHCPEELVEHAVPGGLVTRHRQWFCEERAVLSRYAAATAPRVRAARALFFARLALRRGDIPFGAARLAEAFLTAPLDAARIVRTRLFPQEEPAR